MSNKLVAEAAHSLKGQAKITRSNGDVEVVNISETDIEIYPLKPSLAKRFVLRLLNDKGAIVWTDKGQEKNVDVIDPATRAAQVTTYYGAWGSSATAPAVANTALGTELAEARVATTITQPSANTIQWLWEVTATGNRTVNEAGVFTASSAGDMWIRLTLSTLNIETGDRVEFTVQLAFKDVSE